MGNQLIKNNNKKNIITSKNDIKYITDTDNIKDLTLRNTIWDIIDQRLDFDVVGNNFNIGDINPPIIKYNDDKGVIPVNPSVNYITSTYTPGKTPSVDPVSSYHIYDNNTTPVYINRIKGFCAETQAVEGNNQDSMVSVPLPIINNNFTSATKAENGLNLEAKFDESKTLNYPVGLSNIENLDSIAKLKKLQDMSVSYGLPLTVKINGKDKQKTAEQLFKELDKIQYPNLLDKVYLGYQMKQSDLDILNSKLPGKQNNPQGKGDLVGCDNFMTHQCAKQVYEQGCLQLAMKYDRLGNPIKQVPTWSNYQMCYNLDNTPITGGPECGCLNDPYGPSLNVKPTSNGSSGWKIPYKDLSNNNNLLCNNTATDINSLEYKTCALKGKDSGVSNISLNLYGTPIGQQNPTVIDNNYCIAKYSSAGYDGGISRAYRTNKMTAQPSQINFCMNTVSLGDSNIDTLALNNIKQSNNCGGGAGGQPAYIESDDEKGARVAAETASGQLLIKATDIGNQFKILLDNIATLKNNLTQYTNSSKTIIAQINQKISSSGVLLKKSEKLSSEDISQYIIDTQNIQNDIDDLLNTLSDNINACNQVDLPPASNLTDNINKLKQSLLDNELYVSQYQDNIIISGNKQQIQSLITTYDKVNQIANDITTVKTNISVLTTNYNGVKQYASSGTYGQDNYNSIIIKKISDLYNKIATLENKPKIEIPSLPQLVDKLINQPATLGQVTVPTTPTGQTPPATGQPSTPPATGQPSPPPATGQPSSPPATGQPSSPPAIGQPSPPPATGQPSTPPATGQPSTPLATGQPSSPPATGQPSSPPDTPKNDSSMNIGLIIGIIIFLLIIIIGIILYMRSRNTNNIISNNMYDTVSVTNSE
jgi:hypothetical protein